MSGAKQQAIIPQRSGMCASIPGVLLRAAEAVEDTEETHYLGWGLRELNKHLHELHANPDVETLHSFLSLWRI
jgi:hypothetical protein